MPRSRVDHLIVIVLHNVLHDDGDAPVGRVERGVWFAKALVSEAANMGDLIGVDSIGLEAPCRGFGGVPRKLSLPLFASEGGQ